MEKILIVDDEDLIRWSLEQRLKEEGYFVNAVATGKQTFKALKNEEYDLILLDLRLPDANGIDILKEVSEKYSNTLTILMTAYSSVDSAVKALKLGAYDYVNKPFEIDEMVMTIQKALETTRLRREVSHYRDEYLKKFGLSAIIGRTPAMQEIFKLIRKISQSETTTVLLEGESGTGKDLIAKAIHYQSPRANKPFMNISCTALPETLLESELMGYVKGAFTDAKTDKKGLFEMADGGTVFLDEIGDMPLALQAKLLRFLEERTFRRVGGTKDIKVSVRIIAATNKDLAAEVEKGNFRSDLYYRLKVIPITVPPLRERKEDIPLLIHHFINEFNAEFKKKIKGVSDEAMQAMTTYSWPGNIRELKNVIERAMLLGTGNIITLEDLPVELRSLGGNAQYWNDEAFKLPTEGIDLKEMEKSLVLQALRRCGGNKSKAAKLLKLTRDQMRYRIRKYRLKV